MGRKNRPSAKFRKNKHEKEGPSLFFIIALTIALALMAWGVVKIVQTPVPTDTPAKTEQPAGK